MQINFLYTVRTNINNVIVTFTKDSVVIMLFLYFIVLFTFYACKNDTNNISYPRKTKTNIAIYKLLGKRKDQYIHKQHANFQDLAFTQSGALGFYNCEKDVKVRMRENAHEKKEKYLTCYESP